MVAAAEAAVGTTGAKPFAGATPAGLPPGVLSGVHSGGRALWVCSPAARVSITGAVFPARGALGNQKNTFQNNITPLCLPGCQQQQPLWQPPPESPLEWGLGFADFQAPAVRKAACKQEADPQTDN